MSSPFLSWESEMLGFKMRLFVLARNFMLLLGWNLEKKLTQCTVIFRSMLCSHKWTVVRKICIYLGRNRTVDQAWGPVLSYNLVDWSIYGSPCSHLTKFSLVGQSLLYLLTYSDLKVIVIVVVVVEQNQLFSINNTNVTRSRFCPLLDNLCDSQEVYCH